MKVATKDSFRYKCQKKKKKIISDAKIPKTKVKKCDQNNLCFSDCFQTFLPPSSKYFMEVSVQTSLEVATKVFSKN